MEMMNDTIKTLVSRRSMRKFKKEQILETELEQILAAAVNAPSGGIRSRRRSLSSRMPIRSNA